MAHFAELDENNIVMNVIVVNNEDILDSEGRESEEVGIQFLHNLFGENKKWKQTSYNGSFRKNYASINGKYDEDLDAFIPLQPYSKWIINEETGQWEAPTPYPTDGKNYTWDDENGVWEEFELPNS
jgi:hypothetical protein